MNHFPASFAGPEEYALTKSEEIEINRKEAADSIEADLNEIIGAVDAALTDRNCRALRKLIRKHGWIRAAFPAQIDELLRRD